MEENGFRLFLFSLASSSPLIRSLDYVLRGFYLKFVAHVDSDCTKILGRWKRYARRDDGTWDDEHAQL